jgi:hypothetical protein
MAVIMAVFLAGYMIMARPLGEPFPASVVHPDIQSSEPPQDRRFIRLFSVVLDPDQAGGGGGGINYAGHGRKAILHGASASFVVYALNVPDNMPELVSDISAGGVGELSDALQR